MLGPFFVELLASVDERSDQLSVGEAGSGFDIIQVFVLGNQEIKEVDDDGPDVLIMVLMRSAKVRATLDVCFIHLRLLLFEHCHSCPYAPQLIKVVHFHRLQDDPVLQELPISHERYAVVEDIVVQLTKAVIKAAMKAAPALLTELLWSPASSLSLSLPKKNPMSLRTWVTPG